jgi:hypothetical protein
VRFENDMFKLLKQSYRGHTVYIRKRNALPQRESLNNYDAFVEIDE